MTPLAERGVEDSVRHLLTKNPAGSQLPLASYMVTHLNG